MFNPLRNQRLSVKVALLGAGSVLVTAVILVTLAVWQSGQYNTLAQSEVDGLINADLDHITQGVYNLVQTENDAVQHQVDYNLNVARHILANTGSITMSKETAIWTAVNQFTNKPLEIQLPKMLAGSRWLGQNTDPAIETIVVDEVTHLVGETATIFQRMDQGGNMLRVATTVRTAKGKRAIGTYIPAVDPDGTPNPVISAVLKGRTYHGRAFVVNAWHLTAYEPIKDVAGKIVGMLYVGVKQKTVEARVRQAILQTKVGKTGYVYVLGGKGEERGRYIISQKGERDGEDILDNKDSDGRYVIEEIINKAIALQPGQMTTERYRWKNPGETEPRWKVARLAYYAPWDWVIGTSVYEDELQSYRAVLKGGRVKMTGIMVLAGLIITFSIGLAGILIAWTIARPVRQMTEAVETIIHGDLDQVVDVHSHDEIGILAEAFNLMTERLKQTMEGLRNNEQQLRQITSTIPGVVYQFFARPDGTLGLYYVSDQSVRLFGLEPSTEGFFERFTDLVLPEYRDSFLLSIRKVVNDCSEWRYEGQLCKPSGDIIWFSGNSIPFQHEHEIIFSGVMLDITERKHAEEELRESEQRLSQIFDFLPDATFAIDVDGKVIAWNKAMEEMTGVKSDYMLNKGDYEYSVPFYGVRRPIMIDLVFYSDEEIKKKYHSVVKQGDILLAEADVPVKGEEIRALSGKACPLYDSKGNIVGAIEAIRDITDRKAAESELKTHRDHLEELIQERTTELAAAKEAAERANRAKSDFLARMSHDLRTPLNAIMGYAQILKRQENLLDKQRDQLSTIQESGEHLLALINDILDLSRIEAQKEELQQEAFNLPALIHEVLSATGVKAADKQLSFLYEEDETLPALVRGDPRKLRQVLINLLDNAVKYTPEGSVTLRVAGEEEPLPYPVSSIRFQVSDTGIGIPQEQIEAIFEPFVKGDALIAEGIGLGLAISRHLVEIMGGNLSVESNPEKGSVFTFTLELEVPEEKEATPMEPEKTIIGYQGEQKRILIADDNPTNLAMLVSVLEPLGFIVETAENGEETITRTAAAHPDLILMDLLMPVTNGHDALRRIRDDESMTRIKVIGVSAAVADKERTEKFVADCDGFIAKPVHIKTLLEEIKEQLGIEWIKSEEPVTLMEETVTMPPDDAVAGMLLAAEKGDYTNLERLLNSLTDDIYTAFCNKIRAYAKTYDEEGIIAFIKGADHG